MTLAAGLVFVLVALLGAGLIHLLATVATLRPARLAVPARRFHS